MSTFKGTPGPWEIVPGDEWTTDIGTPEGEYEDGRKRHWNVASVNRRRDEWEANRRLIAAAPELLAIVETFDAYMAQAGEEAEQDSLNPIRALRWKAQQVITKAIGGDA